MRNTESRKVGTAGEWYVYDALATAFNPTEEIEAIDFLDSNGIDLALYVNLPGLGRKKYGVSVKSRNTTQNNNSSLNLHPNDLFKCRKACEFRGLEPAFAFCIMGKESIDILVISLGALIEESKKIEPLGRWGDATYIHYPNLLSSKDNNGIALPIKISPKARKEWISTFGHSEGVLLIQSYYRNQPYRYPPQE